MCNCALYRFACFDHESCRENEPAHLHHHQRGYAPWPPAFQAPKSLPLTLTLRPLHSPRLQAQGDCPFQRPGAVGHSLSVLFACLCQSPIPQADPQGPTETSPGCHFTSQAARPARRAYDKLSYGLRLPTERLAPQHGAGSGCGRGKQVIIIPKLVYVSPSRQAYRHPWR